MRYKQFIQDLTIGLGAVFAIPGWNTSQDVGELVGKRLGFNDLLAGYFSALFTGFLESLTQLLAATVANHLSHSDLQSAFKHAKDHPGEVLTKVGFYSTIGTIPGCAWQLGYAFAVDMLNTYAPNTSIIIHLAVISAVVALLVASLNLVIAIYDQILLTPNYKVKVDVEFDVEYK